MTNNNPTLRPDVAIYRRVKFTAADLPSLRQILVHLSDLHDGTTCVECGKPLNDEELDLDYNECADCREEV